MTMESLKGSSLPSNVSDSKSDDGFLHSTNYFHEYCVLIKVKLSVCSAYLI